MKELRAEALTPVDFSPLASGAIKLLEFSAQFGVDDLRAATGASVKHMRDLLHDATDADVTFTPVDPASDDPYAQRDDERNIAWNAAHIVLHVCASAEEAAAIAACLARGVAVSERQRYEPDWRTFTQADQVRERLRESLRMRLAYLDAWPDAPHLDTLRELSERGRELFGDLNAPANFLLGLRHEADHYAQLADALAQARAARSG